VKTEKSCEVMLAVGRLKREREAVLEVRVSGKGKSEGVGLSGEVGMFGWDGMVTEVSGVGVAMTGNLEHRGRSAMFCGVSGV
jgi:hypothetical protein